MELVDVQPRVVKRDDSYLNPLAPHMPCRIIIIGKSGSGKTYNAINLILRYLDWHTLGVYARQLEDDDKYQALRDIVEEQEEERGISVSRFSNDIKELLPLDSYNNENRNLVLFDDWMTLTKKEHEPIVDYFVRGRHAGVSSIYLSQQYHRIPKAIRLQATHVVLYKGLSGTDVESAWSDFVSATMTKREFVEFYRISTLREHSFIVIDAVNPVTHLRIGWDEIVY